MFMEVSVVLMNATGLGMVSGAGIIGGLIIFLIFIALIIVVIRLITK